MQLKKVIAVGCVSLVLLAVAGCGGGSNASSTTSAQNEQAVGRSESGNIRYTMTVARLQKQGEAVVIEDTLENLSVNTVFYTPYYGFYVTKVYQGAEAKEDSLIWDTVRGYSHSGALLGDQLAARQIRVTKKEWPQVKLIPTSTLFRTEPVGAGTYTIVSYF